MERLFFTLAAMLGLIATLLAPPARADGSVARAEGGEVRLLALPPAADGTVAAVLEITLEDGWITYWREPGDSGIPPIVTPAGGATLERLGFPPPKRFMIGTLRDYGYDRRVLLPLDLTVPAGSERLALSVFLGICREICIPFQADLSAPLATPDPAAALTRRLAEAQLPAGPTADFRLEHASMTADGLAVTLTLPRDAPEPQLIITGASGQLFDEARDLRRDGDRLTGTIATKPGFTPGPEARLLVIAGARSLETPLP